MDLDEVRVDETKSSTSDQTEIHGSTDDAQPPYKHLDQVATRSPTDRAAADEGREPGRASQPSVEEDSTPSPPRQAERRQRPRSTTKCRVVPIVVSGQSTAKLGQLCYETTENADPSP